MASKFFTVLILLVFFVSIYESTAQTDEAWWALYDKAKDSRDPIEKRALAEKAFWSASRDKATDMGEIRLSAQLLSGLYDGKEFADKLIVVYLTELDALKGSAFIKGEPSYYQGLQTRLADIYLKKEQTSLALPLLAEALKDAPKQRDGVITNSNIRRKLAEACMNVGQYERARRLLIEELTDMRRLYQKDSFYYLMPYFHLATTYLAMDQPVKALECTDSLLTILGPDNSKSYSINNSRGIIFKKLGRMKESEKAFKGVIDFFKPYEKSNDPMTVREARSWLGLTLGNLTDTYLANGEIGKAEITYRESLLYPADTLMTAKETYEMGSKSRGAEILAAKGNYREALLVFLEVVNTQIGRFESEGTNLSEPERIELLQGRGDFREIPDHIMTILTGMRPTDKELIQSFDIEMRRGSIALDRTKEIKRLLYAQKDSTSMKLLEKYSEIKASLYKETTQPVKDYSKIQQLNDDEVDQGRRMAIYATRKNIYQQVDFQSIRRQLKTEDAAIAFVHFKHWNKKSTDTTYYAAYVIRRDWDAPRLVRLCSQQKLAHLIRETSKLNGYNVDQQTASELYQCVWAPLDSMIKGSSNLYITPVGSLSRVAFEALITPQKKRLIDMFTIHRLNSLRDISNAIKTPINLSPTPAMILIGGVNYKRKAQNQLTMIEQNPLKRDLSFEIYEDSLRRGISYLPGTLIEVKEIAALWPNSAKLTVLTDTMATEAGFKSLAKKEFEVMHIATHGFYFPEQVGRSSPKEPLEKLGGMNSPLMRSGLLMAGAELAYKRKGNTESDDDGILTAYEISDIDLTRTRLLVFSACDTGLGDLHPVEGVYGLQRAARSAGASQILVSLWPVPDQSTKELMRTFYSNLKTGSSIHDSFRSAQQKLRSLPKYASAVNWAGFILLE